MATFDFFDFRGELSEVGGSCGYALPPARIAIGISTLALPSCAVSPTLARLLRVSICVVPIEYPLVASRLGGITVLYRLLALFVLRGILGHSLTLLKSKFIL